ncbi:Rieske 2Fe-2S domain-containing protein [Alphaproteobacteria bacterium]|jgi:nitrite reductase/ring-hydroxylating ferredoxin subunit|nr:Rieske 2Fe-2S domain-containing protein [Alphaproteobacteria bacterium]
MLKKKIGSLKDLKQNNQFSRWINDHDILIYRNGDKIEAISNICPHFGGPIGYHEIKIVNKNPVFTCLWHNLQFSVNSGQCTTHSNLKLRKYNIEVEHEDIFVYIN